MDEVMQKNFVGKGDAGFEYDKQIEFEADDDDNSWDEEEDDD